ncbi:MAG: 4a-hydroxytetrahydrobiopterin dehydratase [Calditrichia bacterium]
MKLTPEEIEKQLSALSGWKLAGKEISKFYQFGDFKEAMDFVNRLAEEAEAMDHHPDILIRYNRVELTLSTHSEGGLTEKDFRLAKKIDRL